MPAGHRTSTPLLVRRHRDRNPRSVENGIQVALSPTEFNLLRCFVENAGRVLSKAHILDHLWRYDFGADANAVESYMSYLPGRSTPPSLSCCTGCAASGTCSGCPGRECPA